MVIDGGPGWEACWNGLTDLLGRTWQHANGAQMTIERLAVDTGYETTAVYGWARKVDFGQVTQSRGGGVQSRQFGVDLQVRDLLVFAP